MSEPLKIAIIGAGGIGCYYGVRLLQSGHEVTLVARGEHLRVMQQQGLRLQHPDCHYQGPVNALSLDDLLEHTRPDDYDMLLFCVKATATEQLAQSLARWFHVAGTGTATISLQNGIDNEAQLAQSLGEEYVIGGLAVRIGGHITRPGQVEATGIAQIVWGAWPDSDSPAADRYGQALESWTESFNQAGIPTRLVSDIRRELWRKLVINNGVNPLSALTRLDTRTLSHHPEFSSLVYALMREAATAAGADGESLTEQDVDEMFTLIREFDPIKTSMLVDLEKGRSLELQPISGAVISRCESLGIDAPYTRTVHALLKHALSKGNDAC
jgi:2-dehydropantoate 2-reductase